MLPPACGCDSSPPTPGTGPLVATVYTVRDAGDRVMEEETRKWVVNRGPYKKLLEGHQARLDRAGVPAAP